MKEVRICTDGACSGNPGPGGWAAIPPNAQKMKEVRICTDGACSGNPGPGGWAAILSHGQHTKSLSGAEPETTNNRMELRAVIEGLRALKQPCEVVLVTDSRYVHDGIQKWLPNWKRKGWVTAGKDPVKNRDLWEELDALASRHAVKWVWVRGHSGNPENEACDALAVAAIENLRSSRRDGARTVRRGARTNA